LSYCLTQRGKLSTSRDSLVGASSRQLTAKNIDQKPIYISKREKPVETPIRSFSRWL